MEMRRQFFRIGAMRAGLLLLLVACGFSARAEQRVYSILPVGDSITEGGQTFSNYRYPLWEKLHAAGYLAEYVGSRTAGTRVGPMKHEGYGGKNAEFIAEEVKKFFSTDTADIMLIHAGHNHWNTEEPVAGIVDATESMIRTARTANPKIIVLVAQVIPSGKLPKYEYIPELNRALGKLARKLNSKQSPVIAVDMADGFDWQTDTVSDHVHPNASGAEKMAQQWFRVLTDVMEPPPRTFQPRLVPYKKAGDAELMLHVFTPAKKSAVPRPAIVFFFGGGWSVGTPLQFYPECAHFADLGFVAISADYRIATVNKTTPFESVADGKSAIRWVRQHAEELGVDPHRIVAAGASAGGQVAAAAGIVPGLDEPGEDLSVSSKPDALVLSYPVIDNGPGGYGPKEVKERYQEFSPLHNIGTDTPPTLVLLGTKDHYVPVATAELFQSKIEQGGGRCDLKLFPGAGHPIYSYRKNAGQLRAEVLTSADAFFDELGLLNKSTPENSN